MATYILYCGSTSIVIGDLPEAGADRYTTIEYTDNLIQYCLDLVIKGNFHIPGDGDTLLERIKNQFKYIEAAGGYVLNSRGESLVIFRNGLYDLPKGKVEPGEDVETAAVREVEEETGVSAPKIERKLLDTYHFYRWGNDPTIILKKTYWYLMSIEGCPVPVPQTEEGITDCMWVDDSHIAEMPDKTHRNLRILFNLKIDGKI